ncbi:MAG TPA: TIGR03560 family F420-dependent LLM class oxidoreductase [Thermoleophilaceae bacterium]|nr:TIGR03560 family F420-dependent LLM class oxidoreductase [Thermoleophilaceae bacterium]
MDMLRAPIGLGLQIPNFNYPRVGEEELFEKLSDIATTAEGSGFDTVLVMDHLHQIRGVGPPENWMLEGNTILAALAARTERVNLSLLVAGVTYRNPTIHAKITTTLDVISGGRAIHGLGAAWFEGEHNAYDFRFGTLGERFERLEDALNIARAMFTQERASYEGKHHSVREALNNPKPIRGDIPIMIGGSGERKTLRMVAQYADASNFFGDAERIRHLVGVLEGHCERLGRDIGEITKTRLGTAIIAPTQAEAEAKLERVRERASIPPERLATFLVGDADGIAEQASELLDAGCDALIFNMPYVHEPEDIELLGRTLGPLCSDVPSGRSSVG